MLLWTEESLFLPPLVPAGLHIIWTVWGWEWQAGVCKKQQLFKSTHKRDIETSWCWNTSDRRLITFLCPRRSLSSVHDLLLLTPFHWLSLSALETDNSVYTLWLFCSLPTFRLTHKDIRKFIITVCVQHRFLQHNNQDCCKGNRSPNAPNPSELNRTQYSYNSKAYNPHTRLPLHYCPLVTGAGHWGAQQLTLAKAWYLQLQQP